jgi:hypothetical protein
MISSKISSLRVLLWWSGTEYPFYSFSTESSIELFFSGVFFYPFFYPLLHLVLYNYVLDRLVGGFNCLFSFPLFNFCVVTDLVVS